MKLTTEKENYRRRFLKQLAAGSLTALSVPAWASGAQEAPEMPSFSDDESYWLMVKKQFSVPENLVMMNAANLCPSPHFINEKVLEYMRSLGKDVSFQYREVFAERRAQSISGLAALLHVDKEEVGITRNTSESNCIIVNGLDLKAGDEVLIWEQNHPSNEASWIKQSKRIGFIVKKISVPAVPKTADDLVAPFRNAVTTKTKLIAFSQVSNTSGIALPAREICAFAKSKGILTLVDGAQTLGMKDLDLRTMGCSFYTASTHKWLMGPLENGVLYVSKENMERVWPNIIGAGWKEDGHTVDAKACVLGQRNDTTTAALPEILAFHHSVGEKNIENRVVALNTYLKMKVQAMVPQATFVTPLATDFSAGITIVGIPGKDARDIYSKLYTTFGIAGASSGGIRLSPHIYNSMEDVDRVASALKTLAA